MTTILSLSFYPSLSLSLLFSASHSLSLPLSLSLPFSLSHSRSLTPSLTLSPFLTLSLTPSLSHCLLLPLHLSFLTSSPFLTHSLSICLPLVLHFSLFSTFSLSITLLLAPHTHGIYPLGQLSTLSLYCKSQPLPSSSSHFSSCHPSPSISPLLLPPLLSLIFPHSPLNALHPLS